MQFMFYVMKAYRKGWGFALVCTLLAKTSAVEFYRNLKSWRIIFCIWSH